MLMDAKGPIAMDLKAIQVAMSFFDIDEEYKIDIMNDVRKIGNSMISKLRSK